MQLVFEILEHIMILQLFVPKVTEICRHLVFYLNLAVFQHFIGFVCCLI